MLIDATTPPGATAEAGLRWFQSPRFTLGWKGHLYLPGRAAGAESLAVLARHLETMPLARAVRALRGVYGLFVHDAALGAWQVAVDHTGLYQVYHDGRGASTGFLDLLADRGLDAGALRRDKAVEYLAHGAIFDTQTVVAGVRRLARDEVLTLAPDRPPALAEKALDAVSEAPPEAVVADAVRDLVRSLDGRRVSVDVTGGFDSRLVACLMRESGAAFEAAISGVPGTADTAIAARVARALDWPFHLYEHELSRLDGDLNAAFLAGDGLTDLRRFHRDHAHARARLARGAEVMVHSAAGELFKDQHSVHDFPFYGVGRVNLARFYALRVSPVPWSRDDFAPAAAATFDALPARSIARFATVRGPTNNVTYNRINLDLRAQDLLGRVYSNYVNMGLDVAAPFFDRDVAEAGIRMPPWRTVFTRWHRAMLTARCPTLAALPTADGYTASNAWQHLPRNLLGYGVYQARRGAKKASQRLTGKSRFHAAGAFVADRPGFMAALRRAPHFPRALQALKAAGVLRHDLAPAAVRDGHLGRVLTLGLLVERLGP